jgi:tryptophanase
VITVSAPATEVPYGTATTTTFTVTADGAAWAKRPVNVCVAEGNASFKCTSTTTGDTGGVAVQRTATGAFKLQLQIPASDANVAATSPVVGVTVRASVVLVRTGNTMTVTINGAAGQAVQVQRLDGTRWLPALTYKAVAKVNVTGLTTGRSYRVVVPDTTTILGATSTTV